jgi:Mn2+/Fe2+ NRAMP family transporter
VIENGVALLGLVTVCFVVGAWRVRPPLREAAAGLLPGLPADRSAQYGFLAVSIVGATLSPYLLNFYASGAVEDKWNRTYLGVNRVTAVLGMAFGGVISAGVLALSAVILNPRGVQVDDYGR